MKRTAHRTEQITLLKRAAKALLEALDTMVFAVFILVDPAADKAEFLHAGGLHITDRRPLQKVCRPGEGTVG